MAFRSDLNIPFSQLVSTASGGAEIALEEALDQTQIGGLLQNVVESHVTADLSTGQSVQPVSVSFDIAGALSGQAKLEFEPVIDRRTRTLVFANGIAKQAGRPILQATMVYRIVQS